MQKGLWREKGLELRRGHRKGWGNPGRCLWSLGRGLARKRKAPPRTFPRPRDLPSFSAHLPREGQPSSEPCPPPHTPLFPGRSTCMETWSESRPLWAGWGVGWNKVTDPLAGQRAWPGRAATSSLPPGVPARPSPASHLPCSPRHLAGLAVPFTPPAGSARAHPGAEIIKACLCSLPSSASPSPTAGAGADLPCWLLHARQGPSKEGSG